MKAFCKASVCPLSSSSHLNDPFLLTSSSHTNKHTHAAKQSKINNAITNQSMSKSSKIQDLSNDNWDQQSELTISFDSIKDSPNGASINGSPQLVFALDEESELNEPNQSTNDNSSSENSNIQESHNTDTTSPSEQKISLHDFKLIKVIGKGG